MKICGVFSTRLSTSNFSCSKARTPHRYFIIPTYLSVSTFPIRGAWKTFKMGKRWKRARERVREKVEQGYRSSEVRRRAKGKWKRVIKSTEYQCDVYKSFHHENECSLMHNLWRKLENACEEAKKTLVSALPNPVAIESS